jgi:hypothetical protein
MLRARESSAETGASAAKVPTGVNVNKNTVMVIVRKMEVIDMTLFLHQEMKPFTEVDQ